MQVDWTVITLVVITFFTLNGLFKGWWKEAVTTFTVALLVFLLKQPALATQVVSALNQGLNLLASLFNKVLGSVFSLSTDTIQLSATDPLTWFVLMFVLLGGASLLSKAMLPGSINGAKGQFYAVSAVARLLGGLLGGFNGFLILNLAREYLDGRSLPGATQAAASASTADLTVITGNSLAKAASTLSVQAVDLPKFTIMDSVIPWAVIGFGVFLLGTMVYTRASLESKAGEGRKLTYYAPYGYSRKKVKPDEPDKPAKVQVVS